MTYHFVDEENHIDMWMCEDSKMPTPELADFPKTPEIDKEVDEGCRKIARKCF
ncbi:MAG: hypothetical protein PUC44_01060 [Eubacteriales bacterium]|nr:hypothetical protein [Eubacteriales bacterium]